MNDSFSGFHHALSVFADHIGDTHLRVLLVALGLHTVSLTVRARVWRNILRSAFPDRVVGTAGPFWAYMAGVGANAIAPFRGGDVVRIYAIRRLLPGASVATIVSSLVAETMFGIVVVLSLALWAVTAGGLPSVVQIPDANAFEFSFYAQHLWLALSAAILATALALLLLRIAGRRIRGLASQLAAGFGVLHPPRAFLHVVAVPQLVDWILRAATAYFMLQAFGVHASVRAAVLVLVIDSAATAIPITPGGVGTQQALLAFALAGAASQSQLLAYSVGQQAAITLANVALGVVAMLHLFGNAHVGRLHRAAATAP